jgi:hypothetical protein
MSIYSLDTSDTSNKFLRRRVLHGGTNKSGRFEGAIFSSVLTYSAVDFVLTQTS